MSLSTSSSSMQRVQERLDAYRRTKVAQSTKEKLTENTDKISNIASPSNAAESAPSPRSAGSMADVSGSTLKKDPARDCKSQTAVSEPSTWWIFVLKVLLWVLLFGFFVQVEFGMVFLVSSAMYLMYTSMRGSRRKPSELSAYSVFNKNFEKIDGTLSAEQLEREIRFGPGSVR